MVSGYGMPNSNKKRVRSAYRKRKREKWASTYEAKRLAAQWTTAYFVKMKETGKGERERERGLYETRTECSET